MTVAQNAIGQNEKPAPIRVRPGLWITFTRPEFYMSYCDVSQEEFEQLLHKGNIDIWSPKTNSASTCGRHLTWHRNDAESSIIVDDDGRRIAGESDVLEQGNKVDLSCSKDVRKGDLSLFYRTDPAMDIRYLLVAKGPAIHKPKEHWEWKAPFVVAYKFQIPLPLKYTRPTGVHVRLRIRTLQHRLLYPRIQQLPSTALRVADTNWRILNEILAERNPSYPEEIREKFGVDIFAETAPSMEESSVIPVSPLESPSREHESDEKSDAPVELPTSIPSVYERLNRPDQQEFRRRLFRAYDSRCAITGESADAVLEAAHLPRRDHARGHNRASDGILLRADLHRLLDTGLMTFTAKGIIQISREAGAEYRKLHGQTIRFPKRKSDYPQL